MLVIVSVSVSPSCLLKGCVQRVRMRTSEHGGRSNDHGDTGQYCIVVGYGLVFVYIERYGWRGGGARPPVVILLLILLACFADYAVRRHRDDPRFSLQHVVAGPRPGRVQHGRSVQLLWVRPASTRGPQARTDQARRSDPYMRLGAPALLLNHFETSPGRASQVTRATRDGDPPEPASAAAPAGGQAGGPKPCIGSAKPAWANKASHVHTQILQPGRRSGLGNIVHVCVHIGNTFAALGQCHAPTSVASRRTW